MVALGSLIFSSRFIVARNRPYRNSMHFDTVVAQSGLCTYRVYLDSEVVSGEDVTSAVTKLDVRNGGYYLGEEGAGAGILWLLKHCTYIHNGGNSD